jgi:hypothetical protein
MSAACIWGMIRGLESKKCWSFAGKAYVIRLGKWTNSVCAMLLKEKHTKPVDVEVRTGEDS